MKKTLSAILIALLMNVAFGASVFAKNNTTKEKQSIEKADESNVGSVRDEKGDKTASKEKADFYKKINSNNSSFDFAKSEKSTLSDYEKQKAVGKKFSTTTKVLIGVGIAAAVVGIVVFAASRDKIRTF